MVADPLPKIEYHEGIAKKIREWKMIPELGKIWLAYGTTPFVWAQLRTQIFEFNIPIPQTFYPYASWRDWLQDYLEDQVALIAEEEKIELYTLTSKGELQKARRKERIELEV